MKYLISILSLFLLTATPVSAETANLSWDMNTESDLSGYKIYVGTASGVYGTPIDVGIGGTGTKLLPKYTLNEIVVACGEDKTIFIALTAYDTSGNESGFSNEVFKVFNPAPCAPTLAQILAAVEELLKSVKIESKLVFPGIKP